MDNLCERTKLQHEDARLSSDNESESSVEQLLLWLENLGFYREAEPKSFAKTMLTMSRCCGSEAKTFGENGTVSTWILDLS